MKSIQWMDSSPSINWYRNMPCVHNPVVICCTFSLKTLSSNKVTENNVLFPWWHWWKELLLVMKKSQPLVALALNQLIDGGEFSRIFPIFVAGGNICNIVTAIYLREIGVNCVASFENSGGAGRWQITDYTPAAPWRVNHWYFVSSSCSIYRSRPASQQVTL